MRPKAPRKRLKGLSPMGPGNPPAEGDTGTSQHPDPKKKRPGSGMRRTGIGFGAKILLLSLLGGGVCQAQDSTTLSWDFRTNLEAVKTFKQTLVIDGQEVQGIPTCLSLTPSLTSCSLQISLLTPGAHTLSIEAALNGSSAKTVFTGLDLSTTVPNAENARATIVITVSLGPGAPVLSGVTPAPFTLDGHKWDLVGVDVMCDGLRVGGPSSRLVMASGKAFAFVGPNWFQAAGCTSVGWTDVGPQTPK